MDTVLWRKLLLGTILQRIFETKKAAAPAAAFFVSGMRL